MEKDNETMRGMKLWTKSPWIHSKVKVIFCHTEVDIGIKILKLSLCKKISQTQNCLFFLCRLF